MNVEREVPDDEQDEDVPVPSYGYAIPGKEIGAGDAASVFLYVPDLASETGWNVYRVQRRNERSPGRRIGFGR